MIVEFNRNTTHVNLRAKREYFRFYIFFFLFDFLLHFAVKKKLCFLIGDKYRDCT